MADIKKVKRGLKIHAYQRNCNNKGCPYDDPNSSQCDEKLCADALSVIESQQKEIERLNEKVERLKPHCYNVDVDALLKDIV